MRFSDPVFVFALGLPIQTLVLNQHSCLSSDLRRSWTLGWFTVVHRCMFLYVNWFFGLSELPNYWIVRLYQHQPSFFYFSETVLLFPEEFDVFLSFVRSSQRFDVYWYWCRVGWVDLILLTITWLYIRS